MKQILIFWGCICLKDNINFTPYCNLIGPLSIWKSKVQICSTIFGIVHYMAECFTWNQTCTDVVKMYKSLTKNIPSLKIPSTGRVSFRLMQVISSGEQFSLKKKMGKHIYTAIKVQHLKLKNFITLHLQRDSCDKKGYW